MILGKVVAAVFLIVLLFSAARTADLGEALVIAFGIMLALFISQLLGLRRKNHRH